MGKFRREQQYREQQYIDQNRRGAVVIILVVIVFSVGLYHAFAYKRGLIEKRRQERNAEVIASRSG